MRRSQTYGLIASIIASALVLLLLLLITFYPTPGEQEDAGIMISFGNAANGGGNGGDINEGTPPQPTQQLTHPTTGASELLTQDMEDAPAVEKPSEKPQKKPAVDPQEIMRRQQEKERIEAEKKAEQERREREAREQQAIANANRLGGALGGGNNTGAGQGNNDKGSGNTSGSTHEGNPAGHGTDGGNSWSLAGRGINGRLPKPDNDFKQGGKIVVAITVDAAGNVTSANIAGGTTIDDKTQRDKAIEAARKAKFTSGSGNAKGTITYNYQIN